MSNRTLLEFNHDVNWTKDLARLGSLLDSVRRSIPVGVQKHDEDLRDALERFGITYMTTRHHSQPDAMIRISDLERKVRELESDRRKLIRAGKAAASALDALMGDSDLDDDQSPEFKACQRLNRVLDAVSKPAQ